MTAAPHPALHSCIVCVYRRMLKHGRGWYRHWLDDYDGHGPIPVCERHEPELDGDRRVTRGYELYPQGSDA